MYTCHWEMFLYIVLCMLRQFAILVHLISITCFWVKQKVPKAFWFPVPPIQISTEIRSWNQKVWKPMENNMLVQGMHKSGFKETCLMSSSNHQKKTPSFSWTNSGNLFLQQICISDTKTKSRPTFFSHVFPTLWTPTTRNKKLPLGVTAGPTDLFPVCQGAIRMWVLGGRSYIHPFGIYCQNQMPQGVGSWKREKAMKLGNTQHSPGCLEENSVWGVDVLRMFKKKAHVNGTPRRFKIATENRPFEKESCLPTIIFQGLC